MIVSFQLFRMKGEDCVFVTWLASAKQFPKMELEIEKKSQTKNIKVIIFWLNIELNTCCSFDTISIFRFHNRRTKSKNKQNNIGNITHKHTRYWKVFECLYPQQWLWQNRGRLFFGTISNSSVIQKLMVWIIRTHVQVTNKLKFFSFVRLSNETWTVNTWIGCWAQFQRH